MCGRYVITSSAEVIAQLFGARIEAEFRPRFNVAPTQRIPVVHVVDGARHLSSMRWGLTPSWAKPKIGPRGGIRLPDFINARSETAASKPSFRSAWKHRRCILPADGFYEWKKAPDGNKQAHYIRLHHPQAFGMAGIWELWTSPDGETRFGACVLTTQGCAELKGLHDRMPVILHPDHYASWLDPASKGDALQGLMQPLPDGLLRVYPVSNRVNRPKEDDPGLLLEL
jgi:putative SOS response-associated peptidase YedK